MPKQPFSIDAALRFAEEALSKPPPLDWIERPEPRGEHVFSFVLPLELCKPQNQLSRAAMMMGARKGRSFLLGAYKKKVYQAMWSQHPSRREPLRGRAFVRCIRFSHKEVDPGADWAKAGLDVLCTPMPNREKRLNFILDDKGSVTRSTQHWEPVPKGCPWGFGLIQVFTG